MATSLGVAIAFAPNYTVFTILRLVSQSFEGINLFIGGLMEQKVEHTQQQNPKQNTHLALKLSQREAVDIVMKCFSLKVYQWTDVSGALPNSFHPL